MVLTWQSKKRLYYFGIFLIAISVVVAGIIWFSKPQATCFDKKQNQGEEGVDCGGPCIPCLREVSDPIILWARPFKVSEGKYDVAAFIENTNNFAGAPLFSYAFKLYDANNVLVALRRGSTFLNPAERTVFFEPSVDTGFRVPKRVGFEFNPIQWKYSGKERPNLLVVRKSFRNQPFPRLEAEIANQSSGDIKDVYVAALLFDPDNNATGVSVTKLDSIAAGQNKTVFFTWPIPFAAEPSKIDVFTRTNLAD